MNKLTIGAIILVLVLGFGYFAHINNMVPLSINADPQISAIQKRGTLIVATDATYPPLEYRDQNNKIVGFDIKLAEHIAKDLGVILDIRDTPFNLLFESLQKGEVDMVISSVTITAERQKEMSFSSPYLNAGQVIVTRTNSNIFSISDLKSGMVGVQKDTTSQKEAEKYSGQVKTYADYEEAQKDLEKGKLAAIIIDLPAAVDRIQKSNQTLKVVDQPFTSEFYGVVVAKNNPVLLNHINEVIATIKRSGELAELEKTWLTR